MARCNDSSTLSSEAVNACMRRCEQPLHEVNDVVQQEVGALQARHGDALSICAVVLTRGRCDAVERLHVPSVSISDPSTLLQPQLYSSITI